MIATAESRYPLCTSSVSLGAVTLRNRITRSAHGTGYTVDGKVTERFIAYHERRAAAGVGSIFLETCGVHPTSPGQMWAFRDDVHDGWARLGERLHAHDTKVFPQLWHGGAQAHAPEGTTRWAASAIPDPVSGRPALAMTKAMIDEIVGGFAAAAARAKRAGLDGVEVHGAHSYLVCSFLSPMTNLREDEYGGSIESRARFAREILAAIRAECGGEFVVGIRLSGAEGVEGGLVPEDSARTREILEDEGLIDFLSVSLGGYHCFSKMIGACHEPHGYEIPTSAVVTHGRRVPAVVTGRIMALGEAERILESGSADVVSMVRALIADPELVAKSLAGDEALVRPCIGCNEGCVGRLQLTGAAACTVNPLAGLEYLERPIERAAPPRSIMVIGAGPAGLEAARTAALRGHSVVIYDAADQPGGLVRYSRAAPYRYEIGSICDWQWRELERLGVDRRLGSPVDAALVERERPDAVIVATGSLPRRDGMQRLRPALRVQGIDAANVVTPLEVLGPDCPSARTAVVFDDLGNYQAVGAAERLLEEGASVVFATSFRDLCPDLVRSFQQDALVARLGRNLRFRLVAHTSVEQVTPEAVTLRDLDSGRGEAVEADLLVLMTGFDQQRSLHDELASLGMEVHVAGDAIAPLLMPHAIATGHAAGAAV